jgi:hypothetical protein
VKSKHLGLLAALGAVSAAPVSAHSAKKVDAIVKISLRANEHDSGKNNDALVILCEQQKRRNTD